MDFPIPRMKDGRLVPNEELDVVLTKEELDAATTEEARARRDLTHMEQMTRLRGLRD